MEVYNKKWQLILEGAADCSRCKDHKMHIDGVGGGGEGHWQRHPNEKAATRKDTLRSRCVPNCAGKDEHGYGCGYGVRVVNSLGKYPLLVKLHNPLNTPPCSNAHQLALMSKACWGSNWVLLKDSHRKKKLNQNGEVNIFGSFSQI